MHIFEFWAIAKNPTGNYQQKAKTHHSAFRRGDDELSIQYQLVEIVAAEATQLGRYNVFNRQDLKKIFEEQALYMAGVINDSSIIEFGQIAGAKEAMLIKLIQFDQHGIPKPDKKEEETNFFDVIVAIVDASSKKEKEEPHADNIQTVLTFSIKTIDVETGQTDRKIVV